MQIQESPRANYFELRDQASRLRAETMKQGIRWILCRMRQLFSSHLQIRGSEPADVR